MIIDRQEDKNRTVVTAESGYVMTDWKDGDDIRNFNYCRMIYAPLNTDFSMYREITDEEADNLEKQLIEVMEKDEKEKN